MGAIVKVLACKIIVISDPSFILNSHYLTPIVVDAWLLGPWNFPSKNTGIGCHALLQRVIQTQGLNLPVLLYLLHG